MNTILICFSDVHLTGKKPENEGAVIKAFCEDVKQQLMTLQYDDVYVLIGGDSRTGSRNHQSILHCR